MHTNIIFSTVTLQKWKQEARRLKKTRNLAHHDALDEVARQNQFADWHAVTVEARLNESSERALKSGLVAAYDIKDATESWKPDEKFVEDWRVPFFAEEALFKWYVAEDDAESGPVQVDDEYREEYFEWMQNFGYFRWTGPVPTTIKHAMALLNERCFFPPVFVWYNGQLIDPWRDLSREVREAATQRSE